MPDDFQTFCPVHVDPPFVADRPSHFDSPCRPAPPSWALQTSLPTIGSISVKKIFAAILTVSAVGLTAPAMAQDAAAPAPAAQAATAKAGDTVYDTAGEVVATIESVEGQNAVITTGSAKATVPLSSFASGPKGPTISMTKAQLEAAISASK
jgi:hypothetical protein